MISKQLFCAVVLLSAAVYAIGDEDSFLQLKLDAAERKKLYFITKSDQKFADANAIIGKTVSAYGVDLTKKPLKLDEIQGEPLEIAIKQAKDASKELQAPVLIDVKSFGLSAINELPGPYYGEFYDKIGNEGLYEIARKFENYSAIARVVFVYLKSPESQPEFFTGETKGLAVSPVNVEGFKWENMFAPEGYEQPLSQLDEKTREELHPFNRGLKQFDEYMIVNYDWI